MFGLYKPIKLVFFHLWGAYIAFAAGHTTRRVGLDEVVFGLGECNYWKTNLNLRHLAKRQFLCIFDD
jgi:hypothetical protein